MLETKNKILALLKKRQMTISELSKALNLSTATVSQHMDELQEMGSIQRVDNPHFRKLKYYRAIEERKAIQAMPMARYLAGAAVVVVVLALMLAVYAPGLIRNGRQTTVPDTSNNASVMPATAPSPATPLPTGAQSFACPVIAYTLNGSIDGYSGMALYNLSDANGIVSDYVIGAGSTGAFNATELVTSVLNRNSSINENRQHTWILFREGQGLNESHPGIGITMVPATYNAVANETLHFTARITANATASGTYWLYIDGPCGGGVRPILVTIGSKPYNGTISRPIGTFM